METVNITFNVRSSQYVMQSPGKLLRVLSLNLVYKLIILGIFFFFFFNLVYDLSLEKLTSLKIE